MSVYITALKKPEASSRHVNELASTSSPYANGANGVTKATTSVAVKGKGAKGSSSNSMIRVDIQRELRLNGCAIEETKRMAKRREQHIKDLIARIEASHEQKKKRNQLRKVHRKAQKYRAKMQAGAELRSQIDNRGM